MRFGDNMGDVTVIKDDDDKESSQDKATESAQKSSVEAATNAAHAAGQAEAAKDDVADSKFQAEHASKAANEAAGISVESANQVVGMRDEVLAAIGEIPNKIAEGIATAFTALQSVVPSQESEQEKAPVVEPDETPRGEHIYYRKFGGRK